MFTVVIPTIGRPTLPRTLESIPDGVEVLVIADTYQMEAATLAELKRVTREYGLLLLTLDAGRHDRGDSQIAFGFRRALGDWLLNFGDDDVYEPDAFEIMRAAIAEQIERHPIMFKVELKANELRGPSDTILWSHPEIERFKVTGQSFLCPNQPERFGEWDTDWRFMAETVANYGGQVDWRHELIARCY